MDTILQDPSSYSPLTSVCTLNVISIIICVTVLSQMGYRLSPQFFQTLIYRYDPLRKQSLNFDSFIQACFLLKSCTDIFRTKDAQQRGVIQIGYEEFLSAIFANKF